MSAYIEMMLDGKTSRITCGDLLTIGRIAPNHLVIPDVKVSRHHATIRHLGDGRYYLIDVGSANGTYCNGKRVIVPCELGGGAEIMVGGYPLRFFCDPVATPAESDMADEPEERTLLTTGTMMRKIIILVADVRRYTALSEKLDAASLANIMGVWFRKSAETVEKNGGTIDKFIGDAIMAIWHVNVVDPKSSLMNALMALAQMDRICKEVNQNHPDLPFLFKFGAGINIGTAAMGNIGVVGNRDFTAVGDCVNVAFRLEAVSKELKTDVVLGPAAYQLFSDKIWKNRTVLCELKGKKDVVDVFGIAFDEIDRIVDH